MTDLLIRLFIRDPENTRSEAVRTAYGNLAGLVGIVCNLLLCAGKFTAGLLFGSLAVTADAVNNLSDASSNVISLLGFRLGSRPADKEHPFGHGRLEYIAALVVAFLVLEIGFTFFKESIGKIRAPQEMNFQMLSVGILILSIGVKLWMAYFNRKLGKRIDSKVMLATATDAMGDVVTTSATIASLLIFHFTGWNVDGIVGLAVSLIVMWAGVGIAKDTLEPLLGEAVTPEEYDRISRFVEGYDGIVGSHDLIVHNYGPGRSMASIHAEVPNDVDIEESHEIIDRIEREAVKKLGIFLVIHMDPVETRDKKVLETRHKVEQILEALDPEVSIHDFRMVSGKDQNNLIFDMVVPFEYDGKKQEELKKSVAKLLRLTGENYQCVITVERSYVGR